MPSLPLSSVDGLVDGDDVLSLEPLPPSDGDELSLEPLPLTEGELSLGFVIGLAEGDDVSLELPPLIDGDDGSVEPLPLTDGDELSLEPLPLTDGDELSLVLGLADGDELSIELPVLGVPCALSFECMPLPPAAARPGATPSAISESPATMTCRFFMSKPPLVSSPARSPTPPQGCSRGASAAAGRNYIALHSWPP